MIEMLVKGRDERIEAEVTFTQMLFNQGLFVVTGRSGQVGCKIKAAEARFSTWNLHRLSSFFRVFRVFRGLSIKLIGFWAH